MDTSREFEDLMRDISTGQDLGIDNSRISIEKNPGGWVSEYESDKDSKNETEDIKNAIKILIKANLIGEDNSLNKLEQLLDKDQGSESLELLFQLLDIKKNSKKVFLEDTTPMTSIVMNENDLFQTLVSPGHKGPILFESSDWTIQFWELINLLY